MKDQVYGDPLAASHPANGMPKVDAVVPLRPPKRPVVYGEHRRIAFLERNHHGPRLHARPLLGHHELAPSEILSGLSEQ